MTITEMSEMIMRDIADYKTAKRSGDKQKAETNRHYNAYCFEQRCLDYFNEDIKVTDPTNVNMKVEF